MKTTGIALLFPVLLAFGGDTKITRPIFFELPVQFHEGMMSKSIGSYGEDGWIEEIELQLVSEGNSPIFYESSFRTTVCDDEVCEIMFIRLLWDLVGNYVGYDTLGGHPLTKFDHEPFKPEDYSKLHELLLNEGSILKFKKKEELIDKEKVKASDVVDGTTGATAVEIKEEVVEGALYSSYTLWHLAYSGAIKNLISAHTKERFDEGMKRNFLLSGREGYRLFAFQQFSREDFVTHQSDWISALHSDPPLIRKLILRNLPQELWNTETVQNNICGAFRDMDVNTKTILLNKLKNGNGAPLSSMEILSGFLTTMNKNQTEDFLGLLAKSATKHSPDIVENLAKAASDTKYRYAYLVEAYRSTQLNPPEN